MIQLGAQTAPAAAPVAQVEVSSVKFSGVRVGSDVWIEADVELNSKPNGRIVSGEFVNKVRVTITALWEASDSKGTKRGDFYRATTELIALEAGKSNVRFYLPPELVKRDKLRPDVDFYAVELEVAGEIQAPVKASASTKFISADSIKNFIAKGNSEATANEHLFMPQHLTPFASDSQRRSPTPLRREAQR